MYSHKYFLQSIPFISTATSTKKSFLIKIVGQNLLVHLKYFLEFNCYKNTTFYLHVINVTMKCWGRCLEEVKLKSIYTWYWTTIHDFDLVLRIYQLLTEKMNLL